MNFKHLVALMQLRYRLSYNQVKKAGKINLVISIIFFVGALVCSISAFFIGMIGGAIWFQEASNHTILITWNIIVGLFLVIWLIGLLVELQQTELMSLDKLLHLPISLRGAFFLNYTSTFLNASCLMFVPLMFGLALGLIFGRGLSSMISIPLIIGFLFLVTTVTYQIRGWLAGIMENKRKRGTVIVLITIFFVAASQAPHLINMQFAGQRKVRRSQAKHVRQELIEQGYLEIDAQIAAGVVDPRSNGDLVEQLKLDVAQTLQEQKVAEDELRTESLVEIIETADAYVPPGWLPLGIARAAEGKLKTGLLACLGMFGLGLISLTISYRSSIRKYTGTEPRKRRKGQVDQSKLKARSISQTDFLFRKLPWASEHVSAVAVSSFRSMMRAPETKMILLMPIVMGLLGLSMVLAKSDLSFPSFIRPWLPIGVITISMFSVTSVLFNQFGWDRDGFRAFVLSPIERYRILVGKNISIAPLALGVCVLLILGVQFFIPQSFLSFLATLVQIPNVYLMYCLLGNIVSIFLPMGIKRGTMQPANPRFLPMLAMMFGMMLGPGFLLLPTIVSLGVPQVLEFAFKWPMGGLYLLFSLVQFGFALWFYRWNIKIQGRWLQQREPKILEAVANIPE